MIKCFHFLLSISTCATTPWDDTITDDMALDEVEPSRICQKMQKMSFSTFANPHLLNLTPPALATRHMLRAFSGGPYEEIEAAQGSVAHEVLKLQEDWSVIQAGAYTRPIYCST
jgi:hypothetical protein